MQVIVIAGGGRHVGKTTLARQLKGILPSCHVVKLGTHAPKVDKPETFFPHGTSFKRVRESLKSAGELRFLIVESGAILDDPDLVPDLVIFLPAPSDRADKPGSERRRARSDLIRGRCVSQDDLAQLALKLSVETETAKRILDAVGVPLKSSTPPPAP